jgi:hypothetical protein
MDMLLAFGRSIAAVGLVAMLAACGKDSSDGGAYVGTWVRKNDPGYQVVIAARDGGSYTITWNRTLYVGRPASSKAFDADLVNGKLVSPGFTTFLRDDGVLVFAEHEYLRQP